MKLYSEGKNYKLYEGNMLDMAEVIAPNSIDSIVTDPPYELNFMNKGWDNSGIAFQKSAWEKCYQVLKPGGYLLAFGGTRTYHRIACAIEDAGFEIRDTIMWLYGCLSEDTEVLTQKGFKQFHKITKDDMIRVYDIKNGIYKWEKPERWSVYTLDKDTCYRIKSDSTNQLVSRNHRCLVEREGSLVFEFAENLNGVESVPILSYNIPYLQKGGRNILFPDLLWQGEGLAKEVFDEWQRQEKSEEMSLWGNQPVLERWSNLSETERQLFLAENKVCEVPEGVYINGEKRWLCDGTSTISCTTDMQTTIENRNSTSYKSQCGRQQIGEFDAICNEQGSQTIREWKSYTTTLATVTKEEYTGIVFCPTVSTGCFVARRNDKVFITGNSGFPKSLNISLAIDKKNGVKSELGNIKPGHEDFVNRTTDGDTRFEGGMDGFDRPWMHDPEKREAYHYEKLPTSEEAKRWQGWGTSLKPAYEPIIIARKPCEGTCVDNVLKYGVGGINIDECRIPLEDGYEFKETTRHARESNVFTGDTCGFDSENNTTASASPLGRFPSNVILTYDETDQEEVCGSMPDSKGACSQNNYSNGHIYRGQSLQESSTSLNGYREWYNDDGSAARYFYCAKASKRDRDEGCDAFEEKRTSMMASNANINADGEFTGMLASRETAYRNNHPTVKPCDLMSYLVRLVTPKGGTVLDPFNGSGSTGKAVAYENFDREAGYKYIGIELSSDYLAISDARIKYVEGLIKQIKLF